MGAATLRPPTASRRVARLTWLSAPLPRPPRAARSARLLPTAPAASGGVVPPTRAAPPRGRPAHPARLRWGRLASSARCRRVGPLLLSSSRAAAAVAVALQVLTFRTRRRAPALPGRRLWRRPTLEGPSAAPRRSRRPGSGGHEARPRSPALASPAAAAMSRGPEEVNRLTESTYRVSWPGAAQDPGSAGVRGSRAGVPGTVEAQGFEAGEVGRPRRRPAVLAGGDGRDFSPSG